MARQLTEAVIITSHDLISTSAATTASSCHISTIMKQKYLAIRRSLLYTVAALDTDAPMFGTERLNLSGYRAMRRRFIDHTRKRKGTAALEFALVAPVLFLTLFGTFQFGITLNNYVVLTSATETAARQFALSRGGSTTPQADAMSLLRASAATLTGTITINTYINGNSCSDPACATTMTNALGQPAMVAASYPCSLVIYGHDYLPGCTLTSQTTERIE